MTPSDGALSRTRPWSPAPAEPGEPEVQRAARISVPMPRPWDERPSQEPVWNVPTIPKSVAPMLVMPTAAPSTTTARLSSHSSGDGAARQLHQYCWALRSSSGDSKSVHGI